MRKKTSVLIIDDDPFTLAMTKKIVEGFIENGKIRTFCSAKDALNYLKQEIVLSDDEHAAPGIILSDLHMPCIDGFQFLDEFARFRQAIKRQYRFFIVSSTTDEQERARLFQSTCLDGFCCKPLTPGKFIALIEQAHINL